jgi:hypothetical protein
MSKREHDQEQEQDQEQEGERKVKEVTRRDRSM